MFDTIAGLPVHILVIHAVVAFAPLAALLAIGYAVRPAWRRVLRWPVALLAVATGVGGFVGAESGEALERRLVGAGVGGETLDLIHEHAEAGDLARTVCLAFAAIALVAVLWLLRPGRGGVIGLLVAAILVIASVAVTATVLIAGHKGSTAVWSQTISGTN